MEIKEKLHQVAHEIEPSKDLFNEIKKNIYKKEFYKKMDNNRGILKSRKSLLITTVICLIFTSITIIGAGLSKSWSGHTNIKYMKFPTDKMLLEDVGFVPKCVEEISPGFKYKRGGSGVCEVKDEMKNTVATAKQVSLTYEKLGSKEPIILNAMEIEKKYLDYKETDVIEYYDKLPIYYYEHTYKFVPADYKLTEEDKQLLSDGSMAISRGSREVKEQQYQNIVWYDEGIEYSISGFDHSFEIDEMLKMVELIILK